MPAKSKSQKRLMGMALAYKKGKLKKASDTVKKLAKDMSIEDLEDLAKTPEKDLPDKVKKESIKFMDLLTEKVPDNIYQKIKDTDRIVNTKETKIEFFNKEQISKSNKPRGLWYGIGKEWIKWVREEMPNWEENKIFKIEITDSVLILDDLKKIREFEKEYGVKESHLGDDVVNRIKWSEVAKKWSGVELLYPHGILGEWRHDWDVRSGCIWNKSGLKSIKKITVKPRSK